MINKLTPVSRVLLLSILTIVLGALAYISLESERVPVASLKQERLLPGLMGKINEVKKIVIERNDGSFSVVLDDVHNKWVIPEQENAEASWDHVRGVLVGLAELVPLEEKTNDPHLYSKLDLMLPTDPNSHSTQVTLYSENNKPLLAILIGKEWASYQHERLMEYFVRSPSRQATWLVVGSLPPLKLETDWMDVSNFEEPG